MIAPDKLAPGAPADIVKDPAPEYHSNRLAVSQGALQSILTSPAHFATVWSEPYSDFGQTPLQRQGTIVHCALFEPGEFARYVVMPDFGDQRTKANKEAKEAWLLEHGDAPTMSAKEQAATAPMIDAVGSHPLWQALTRGAVFERSIYWREPKTGVRSRARIDALNFGRRMVIDLKTTESAGEKEFSRHIENFGYHFQAAHYLEAARAVGFEELTLTNSPFDYVFCVAERNPPYGVKFYSLDGRALARAAALRDQAYDILSRCIETNRWPGYEPVISPVDLPHWAYTSSGESF